MRKLDLTGRKFCRLTVIRAISSAEWHCECECGKSRAVQHRTLRQGQRNSCGCLAREVYASRPVKHDLTGQRFERWTVIRRAKSTRPRTTMWAVQCDCGTVADIQATTLANGRSRSCGCLMRELASKRFLTHGETIGYRYDGSKEYRAWKDAKARCHNPSHASYKHYGARGVSMCEAWRNDFSVFLRDVGRCPDPTYSLDRIDCYGNYEPGNVRWADSYTQATNTRRLKPRSAVP